MTGRSWFCQWRRAFLGARARILVWYIALMTSSVLVSTWAAQTILFERLQEQVEASMSLEVKEFRRLLKGRNPETGQPFHTDVAAIFNVFLSRNITEDGEYFIALLDNQLYQASSSTLPEPLQPKSALVKRWKKLTETERGQENTPSGKLLYWAEPVRPTDLVEQGDTAPVPQAVFVVAHFINNKQQDALETVIVVAKVSFTVLVIASILAWVVAGQILLPLRLLTETARSISDSDLTQRIPVKGSDELAEMAMTFNEMLERLETAFFNQRNLINDVSHELRTPITIIRGHLELMGDDPDERRETIELVMDELDRMSRLVNDLLLLARAEQPHFLNLEMIEIRSLTEELYAKAMALGDRNWQLDAKGSGRIVADRQRLTQMIMNLAQNATQHTQTGDVIALGSAVLGEKVHFWVRDTGCGIEPQDQKRIFDRSSRIFRDNHRSEGTGLGLAIISTIARAHGGHINVNSIPGQGSTFTIVLPFDPPQVLLPKASQRSAHN